MIDFKKSVWVRVTKENVCSGCGSSDWCTYCEDGYCCMRLTGGKPMKNGGNFFKYETEVRKYIPPIPQQPQVVIDANGMWQDWSKEYHSEKLKGFAKKLGVETLALMMIGCVWATPHNAWAFPMHDENQKIIGIRLRNESGYKWAVKGSKAGLFMPRDIEFGSKIFIVEGPTDAAAALSLNFAVIGRPSCLGCEDMINRFIAKNRIKEVVIVSDNDGPGQQGAEKLQNSLKVSSVIWTPMTKDIREFLNMGGSRELVNFCLKQMLWEKK